MLDHTNRRFYCNAEMQRQQDSKWERCKKEGDVFFLVFLLFANTKTTLLSLTDSKRALSFLVKR